MDWNRVQDKAAKGDSFSGGVAQGAWDGGKALVTGAVDLGKAGVKLATDDAYREQAFDQASRIAQATRQFGAKAMKDPIGTGESIWDKTKAAAAQAKQAFVEARDAAEREGRLNNFYGSLIGRGGFEIASMFVPITKLGLVAKGAKGAATLGKVTASTAKVAGKANKLKKAERLNRRQKRLKAMAKRKVGLVQACNDARTTRLKALHAEHAADIKASTTFKTKGVTARELKEYFKTPAGSKYLELLKKNNPDATDAQIKQWAGTAIRSGKTVPKHLTTSETLVKIVPEGKFKDTTPFWTTEAELKKAIASGRPLNEVFGLPMASDADTYKIYHARPKPGLTPDVFRSTVAPTLELEGLERRAGGAVQYLVPDRSSWEFIDTGQQVKNAGGSL